MRKRTIVNVPDEERYLLTERLIGACLMASALLDQESESDNARKVAGVLRAVLAWVDGDQVPALTKELPRGK